MANNKDEPIQKEGFYLEDNFIVAFMKVRGYIAIPWICRDDPRGIRVAFEIIISDEEKEQVLQAYHTNEDVGIQDYVRSLREVKSAIYDMKKIGQGKR